MIIGIDITLLCLEKPTGVPLYARNFTEAMIQAFPADTFKLFACVPRHSESRIRQLPFLAAPNVHLSLISLPSRVFQIVMPIWQRMQWPMIEFFLGKLDVFHNFDWFALPSHASSTAVVYDLTPLSHPQWHTPENVTVFSHRIATILSHYSQIISISQATKKDITRFYPNYALPISVVYPDAVLEKTKGDKNAVSELLAQHHLKPGYLFMVSTIEPRKNMARTLKAYLKLERMRAMPPLVIAGSMGWDEEAKRLIKESKHIHSIGYVSNLQLALWYRGSLALVYPSLAEGFGIPIVEAMRSETMIITSNVSSMPEVGGEAVWYCNPLSEASIQDAMLSVVTVTKHERERRIKLGLHQASRFSYRESAQQMRYIWQQLCAQRNQ